MPELPEVETTRRGIAPHIAGRTITQVIVRDRRLRYPVTARLASTLAGQTVHEVARRGKYLLLACDTGTVIIHLGMSGSLVVSRAGEQPHKHDHVDILFGNGDCLRLRDPRRFGAVLWTTRDPHRHKLLAHLGVEPLSADLDGAHLFQLARARRVAVKQFIMDSGIVVGVGNIYASEALFVAGIHPARAAGRIALARYQQLALAIKQVLSDAIDAGGTTLRDFRNGEGRPGYFQQRLRVYQRAGLPCDRCGSAVRQVRTGQRSTYYCHRCQV
jgi:formamidopyrimidine-DNA glycosylase